VVCTAADTSTSRGACASFTRLLRARAILLTIESAPLPLSLDEDGDEFLPWPRGEHGTRRRLPTQLRLLLRSTCTTFRRQLNTFLLQSVQTDSGKQTDDCFVMRRRRLRLPVARAHCNYSVTAIHACCVHSQFIIYINLYSPKIR